MCNRPYVAETTFCTGSFRNALSFLLSFDLLSNHYTLIDCTNASHESICLVDNAFISNSFRVSGLCEPNQRLNDSFHASGLSESKG